MKTPRPRLLALLLSLPLTLTCALGAHAAIDLAQPVPTNPQVTVGTLPNGLTYYIQKNGKPEHKAELRLVVKAGSMQEDDDQQGLAHFIEHMGFNGSKHFKKHELVSYLQSIGVQFGADLNAYTSFDETVYILPIPTDKKENLDQGLTVLEDWAGGATLADADIDKERAIVLEEARLGKGAQDRMGRKLYPKLFNGSRYAARLPIGKEPILRSFKPAVLRRFYHDWYRPDLMAVIAVGDLDPAQVEALIKQHFSALANPAHERARTYATIAPRQKSEGMVITDPEANNSAVLIRYPVHPRQDDGSFAEYRRQLVQQLFSMMLNERLGELTQLANPPFVGGGSGQSKLVHGYESYASEATLGRGGATPAIDALVHENERARQFGFAAEELERAKKVMMRSFEQGYAEREKTDSVNFASEYVRNFLDHEPIPGIANEYAYAQELIPGISLAEMNAFARSTIPSHAPKLAVYMGAPKGQAPVPPAPALLAAVDKAERASVAARAEEKVGKSLMDAPPRAGTIVSETSDAALGTTTLTLSNGVQVILKPTDFRNDQVLLSAARPGGQTQFGEADIYNARYANAVVATMGVNGHSPVELQKILAGKSASVRFGMGEYTDQIGGNAGSNDIETMLQLVYLHFTNPRRDPDLYQSFVRREQDMARNALAQPEAQFRDALISTLYHDNPRVGLTPRPEDFTKIDMNRAVEVFRQRFGSARGLTFILAGSFDKDKVKPLLATYLGSLPTPDLAVEARDVGIRPVTGVVKKEVHAGTEPKSDVVITFTGPATFSEPEQLRFYALVDLMNIRITDVLREKLTLIYGGGMQGNLTRLPYAHYGISTSLPCGPENVDKVIAALTGEIRQLQEHGPEVADLNKVKENWLQEHAKRLRENGYWVSRLQSAVLDGIDPHSILSYEKDVAALTPDDMRAAAQHYFNLQNYVQMVLYPQASNTAAASAGSDAGAAH